VAVEGIATEEVEATAEKEEKATDKLEEAIVAVEESSEELAEALIQEEEAIEEKEETIEAAEKSEDEEIDRGDEPFIIGDEVLHGVYGDGTVTDVTEIGKHWSIKVDFEKDQRTILGTFLTLKDVSEDVPEKIEEPQEDAEAYQRPSEEETETEEDEPEDAEEETEIEEDKPTEEEPELLATVMAEAVVEEPVDHGDYEPGTKVSHAIFGVGEVKDSKPKGENYRLDIDFEDSTSKTLLSTFIEIVSDDSSEEKDDDERNDDDGVNEVVEAEAIAVEAEAVVAEPVEDVVEAETVLDTDVVHAKDNSEAIIDLSKPDVQDAEIVDEDD